MIALILSLVIISIFGVTGAIQPDFKLFDYYSPELRSNVTLVNGRREPPYTPLLYFLQYVFLGPPKPNQPSIFDIIEQAPDDTDLLSMIIIASQQFNLYWTENDFDEDTFDGY